MEVRPVARIVIVGASEASRTQLSRLLASSGYDVFRLCASGGELRRALNACEDGVIVLLGAAPGCQIDELAEDFGGSFQILLIGRPGALAACESPKVFKLNYPCAGSAVTAAVDMLSQLHAMRLPRRTAGEKDLVDNAKRLLMLEKNLTEPAAHRLIQQYAMRHGVKMTDYAALLLQGRNDHA